jgi:hypothetical protein
MTEETRKRARKQRVDDRLGTVDTWRRIFEHATNNMPAIEGIYTKATFGAMCWNMLLAVEAEDSTREEKFHALHYLSRLAIAAIEDGVISKQQLQLANPMDVRLPDEMVEWLQVWNDYSESAPRHGQEVPEA